MGGSSKYGSCGCLRWFLEDNFSCKTLLFIWSTLQETNMAIEIHLFQLGNTSSKIVDFPIAMLVYRRVVGRPLSFDWGSPASNKFQSLNWSGNNADWGVPNKNLWAAKNPRKTKIISAGFWGSLLGHENAAILWFLQNGVPWKATSH